MKSYLKRIIASVGVLSLILSQTAILFSINIAFAAPTGTGDEYDPYIIDGCDDWVNIAENSNIYFAEYNYYKLTNSIDCSADENAVVWGGFANPFIGELNGRGHTINIEIDSTDESLVGLFSVTGFSDEATISNLQVTGSVTSTGENTNIGGLIGHASDQTNIDTVSVQLDVTAPDSDSVGGVVGSTDLNVSLDRIVFNGAVSGSNDVGGIIGATDGTEGSTLLARSYAAGSVTGDDSVGGLIGVIDDSGITFNNFAANLVAAEGDYVGSTVGKITLGSDVLSSDNYYDSVVNGLGADTCATIETEGGAVTGDQEGECDGVDTSENADYFYDESNLPFSDGEASIWNQIEGEDQNDIYLAWYFSGEDYPVLYAFEDEGDFTGAGRGTEETPYIITTCEEFTQIKNNANNLSASYILEPAGNEEVLDCSGIENEVMIRTDIGRFNGTFDGNEKTIIVEIDSTDVQDIGLFGRVEGAEIFDITVEGNVAADGEDVGALIGDAQYSTVYNAHSEASVRSAMGYVGGLIGYIDEGTIVYESSATGDVTSEDGPVGGLVGQAYSDTYIYSAFATGNVEGGGDSVGGLIGEVDGAYIGDLEETEEIEWVYATGNVNGVGETGGLIGESEETTIRYGYATGDVSSDDYTGGFLGDSDDDTIIYRCYATGDVTGGEDVGGFMGDTESGDEIYESFATGDVVASGGENVGGFIGRGEDAYIENAYARGSVTSDDDDVGGFIGEQDEAEIYNAYATGFVTAEDYYGGFIGYESDSGDIYASFWDIETTGQEDSDDDDSVGKTTAEMKAIATYTTDLGEDSWDFDEVWAIDEEGVLNDGYPYFQWQEFEEDEEEAPVVGRRIVSSGGSSSTTSKANTNSDSNTNPDNSDYAREVQRVKDEGIVKETPTAAANKCEVLMMMSRVFEWEVPEATASNYTDLPDWCVSLAAFGTTRGIVEGRTPTTLGLETPVTRFEVAVMVHRELKLQNYAFAGTEDKTFTDPIVPWAQEAVAALAKEGILKGFPNGTFGGEQGILKQDLGVILIRVKDNM